MENSIGLVETRHVTFAEDGDGLPLESGRKLWPVTLAYETYGSLNRDRSNAILVEHALSGDAHAAGFLQGDEKPGWWDNMIGPGKAFDTDRYFIICSNAIGGCKGSTGPSSINPETGKPYARQFPFITIGDMVNAQKRLLDHLGIHKLLCVTGGSMGGMKTLQWVASAPQRVRSAIPIATTMKHSPFQIAFNEVGRQAIMADPSWKKGNYYEGAKPERGLAVARMIGHITYMSDRSMEAKFSRRLKNGAYSYSFAADFEVEGYLQYRGESFVKRFDANSYLYFTKAMDYFDVSGGKLIAGKGVSEIRFLVLSFKSDWLYPSYQSRSIARELRKKKAEVDCFQIKSTYGHDAFLLEVEAQTQLIRNFLERLSEKRRS
jgi:homoserine O-acetyltransferase